MSMHNTFCLLGEEVIHTSLQFSVPNLTGIQRSIVPPKMEPMHLEILWDISLSMRDLGWMESFNKYTTEAEIWPWF